MTREDVVKNIMATYGKYGFTREVIEEQIVSGEEHGFSYQTIYTGLRMTLGSVTGEQELFTVSEMAEALGESEETIKHQIEECKEELEATGENVKDYFREVKQEERQRFVIPSGELQELYGCEDSKAWRNSMADAI